MKILFWLGYQKERFDANTKSGLAGTELAVINIAENLALFGYHVVVSGEVKPSGFIRGVEWIDESTIHQKYFNQFDIIVGVSYAHFVLEFKDYTKAKKIYWAHNTEPWPWWKGQEIPAQDVVEYLSDEAGYIDDTVCLTKWHETQWKRQWHWKTPSVIGNGINTSTFISRPTKTINSFIWSSAIDRGLLDLLENWPRIKETLSDATLNVYWPSYSNDYPQMNWIRDNQARLENLGVTFHGPVSQETLHAAMLRSEYWCYLTDYEETYCITALEMQYAGVIPITTPTAALKETVSCGLVLENTETKWDSLIQSLSEMSPSLKRFASQKARDWAKKQTWFERAFDWKALFDKLLKQEHNEH